MSVRDADVLLASLGLHLDPSNLVYSNVINEGFIIDQDPQAGESFRDGDTVKVTVSLGSRLNAALRNIRGRSPEEARGELYAAGLTVSEETLGDFSDDVPEGFVIECRGYDPQTSAETEVQDGGTVRLVLSRGREDSYVRVPKLVMLTVEQAQTIAAESGLTVGAVNPVQAEGVQNGVVVAQSIEPETQVKRGSVIDLNAAENAPAVAGQESPGSGMIYTGELSRDYYYGSIDIVATVGQPGGPAQSAEQVDVFVRLKQRVGGAIEYSMIEDVMPVKIGSRLPLNYTNVRGAAGVESGEIEIVNAVTGDVYGRYPISFHPLG